MSKFDVRDNQGSVQTVAEFDELLERYKAQSPEKYAAKLASGEFDRFRKTLVDYVEPKKAADASTSEADAATEGASPTKRSRASKE